MSDDIIPDLPDSELPNDISDLSEDSEEPLAQSDEQILEFGAHNYPRISVKQLFSDLMAILNLEKGALYTFWCLLRKPGETIRGYLKNDRHKHVNPLRFLILSTAIAAFVNIQFVLKESSFENSFKEGVSIGIAEEEAADPENIVKIEDAQAIVFESIQDFFETYQNLIYLLFIPFISLFTYFGYRRNKYYYGEHLVINAFSSSVVNVIYVLSLPLLLFYPNETSTISLLFMVGYTVFVYIDVFRRASFWGAVKSLFLYVLASILYFAGVFAIVIALLLVNLQESGLIE